jgi:hypothetical protein
MTVAMHQAGLPYVCGGDDECAHQRQAVWRAAANSATPSRSGEHLRPVPRSRRASSPLSGMTLTITSFCPSTGCQSSFHPGLMPNFRATSAGMVTIFFWVTVVIMGININHENHANKVSNL